MIFKYEGISHNVRRNSQCTGSIMGIFLLCSGKRKEASVATASERVGEWCQRTPEGKLARWWEVNVRTLAFILSLINYRVLFFTYKRIILATALKTDFERARIEAKRPIWKLLQ